MIGVALKLAERGWINDPLLKFGIRSLLKERVSSFKQFNSESFMSSLSSAPVAVMTDSANEQHYEVPAEYFELVLGAYKKYSSCLWDKAKSLSEAEVEMLNCYVERAELSDGMSILELGCGWGSFLLFAAQKFPKSKFVGVSNSNSQREYIIERCRKLSLTNVEVITANMTDFETTSQFDRVVSIEMFEHMRNYEILFSRISRWLKLDGKFFLHIFTHKEFAYPFETDGDDNWMGKYFFTGGMMPAQSLPKRFQKHLELSNSWQVSGVHYAKTCSAWLENHDRKTEHIMKIFRSTYGSDAKKWFHRWRLFYLSCAELFDFNEGSEWFVSHYLFKKRALNA